MSAGMNPSATQPHVGPVAHWRDFAFAILALGSVALSLALWNVPSTAMLLVGLPGTLVLAYALAWGTHRLMEA